MTTPNHPLIGKYFHTSQACPCGGMTPEWQGCIVATLDQGVLLIELFSWLDGAPVGQQLISLTDFMDKQPLLYDTTADMRFSAEHGEMRHRTTDHCLHVAAHRTESGAEQ